jgi:hypothetical protein
MNAWLLTGVLGQGLWLAFLLPGNAVDSAFIRALAAGFALSLVGLALIWRRQRKAGAYLIGICNLVGIVPVGWIAMVGANKVLRALKAERGP